MTTRPKTSVVAAALFALAATAQIPLETSAFVTNGASRAHSIIGDSPRHSTHSLSSDVNVAAPCTSNDDEIAVKEQLGYLPTNFVKVTSRSAVGKKPVAIQTYPLNGGATRRKSNAKGELTPFPTLYWLCCPEISRAVADLERRGYVAAFEERLRSKEHYVEQYIAAHNAYAEERWESLTVEDRDMLQQVPSRETSEHNSSVTEGMVTMIQNSGIGGRAKPFEPCVKCLHSHYAHYRSGGNLNVVGKWTDDMLREQFPELDL